MNDDVKNMGCEAFQAHLPELIGTGEDISSHPHLQECDLCRDLLAQLETIAEAARQLFPLQEPPDGLWEQIDFKIKSESKSANESSFKAGTEGGGEPAQGQPGLNEA